MCKLGRLAPMYKINGEWVNTQGVTQSMKLSNEMIEQHKTARIDRLFPFLILELFLKLSLMPS